MDGGGLTVRDGSLVSVWRRERDVYIAEEAKGNSETRIAAGQDAAIAATRQGVFAIWSASPGIELLTPAGGPPRRLSGAGAFPAIAALADGSILAAWEDDGRIAVQSIPVR
jgi:hypothetical protein